MQFLRNNVLTFRRENEGYCLKYRKKVCNVANGGKSFRTLAIGMMKPHVKGLLYDNLDRIGHF